MKKFKIALLLIPLIYFIQLLLKPSESDDILMICVGIFGSLGFIILESYKEDDK